MDRQRTKRNTDPPRYLFDGSASVTAHQVRTLADIASLGACCAPDRMTRQALLEMAATGFDAASRLERRQSCGRGLRGAA